MGVAINIFIKTQEASIERFAKLFFNVLNIKDYEERESLNYGGEYYRFWLFGVEGLLYRNWDVEGKQPINDEFQDYNYYFEFYHDLDPQNVSAEAVEEVLHEYLSQLIAFTLDVETAYQFERPGEDKSEIRMFRKNPNYEPDKGISAILTDRKLTG